MMMLNPRQDPKGSRYVHTQVITPTSPPVIVAFESSAAHVPLNTGGAGGVGHQLPFLPGFPVRASCLLLPHLPQVSCSLYDRFLFLSRLHQRGMTRTLREHATWAGWEGIAEGHPWLAESSRSRFPKRQMSGTPSSGPFWGTGPIASLSQLSWGPLQGLSIPRSMNLACRRVPDCQPTEPGRGCCRE